MSYRIAGGGVIDQGRDALGDRVPGGAEVVFLEIVLEEARAPGLGARVVEGMARGLATARNSKPDAVWVKLVVFSFS